MARLNPITGAAAYILLVILLVGCHGGGSGVVAPLTAPQRVLLVPPSSVESITYALAPMASVPTIVTWYGAITGLDNHFSPVDGDAAAGGKGQAVDGITCDPTMSNDYHVHVWIGIFVSGIHYATPDVIGMKNPGPEVRGGTLNAGCYYALHTHDASGIIHIESPVLASVKSSQYRSKAAFDIWGITVNPLQVGPFSGPVTVYTSGQVYRGSWNKGLIPASLYTRWNGDPNEIPLYSHEVIFLLVGPTYPTQLPNVQFYTEF
jgi:hypothetical protein